MGKIHSTSLAGRKVEPLRVRSTHHRQQIVGMTDAEAKEYLLEVVELGLAEAKEGFARIKDAVPHADKRGAQVLHILWSARPRIKTYEHISQQLKYLNGNQPNELALSSVVKRLRRALEKTDLPVEIRNHYAIGYNLHAPSDWQAPWDDE